MATGILSDTPKVTRQYVAQQEFQPRQPDWVMLPLHFLLCLTM